MVDFEMVIKQLHFLKLLQLNAANVIDITILELPFSADLLSSYYIQKAPHSENGSFLINLYSQQSKLIKQLMT
jgi:hypothetical protein